ncbi:hypothetical protein ANME2D_00715 [Candidatus Methanoperedens nitroreducens]|uniref:YozE SAM-like domain-containing protein n=1 Tax=Candidatus Methanoperedens nitratireducens TaxID=1392998 RepID=A0A062VAU0_9EURY|nr:hypothetical protein ANME2D_00715 [Candidatus Methanoperedens nitroreducens]MDJ1422397.1 YozE family protein [Candidatus Methanoperedens sp.]
MSGDTFMNWLKGQKKRDDPVGDLARDVLQDSRTRRFTTYLQLRRYLDSRGVHNCVSEACRRANDEYQHSKRGD